MDPDRCNQIWAGIEHASVEGCLHFARSATSQRHWQKRSGQETRFGKSIGQTCVARLLTDRVAKYVTSLCGWTRQKVDLEVLAMAASMDSDNADAFKRIRAHAEQSLESTIFGKGQTYAKQKLNDPKKMDAKDKKKWKKLNGKKCLRSRRKTNDCGI